MGNLLVQNYVCNRSVCKRNELCPKYCELVCEQQLLPYAIHCRQLAGFYLSLWHNMSVALWHWWIFKLRPCNMWNYVISVSDLNILVALCDIHSCIYLTDVVLWKGKAFNSSEDSQVGLQSNDVDSSSVVQATSIINRPNEWRSSTLTNDRFHTWRSGPHELVK